MLAPSMPQPFRSIPVMATLLAVLLHCAPESTAASTVQATIEVFPCSPDTADRPDLTVDDVAKAFAAVPASPHWSFEGQSWKTKVAIADGHYVVHARTKKCSGKSEQWVAVAGEPRHVVITLNKGPDVFTLDENMFTGAVYGTLPSELARVEIMSADSVFGEQTRTAAVIDGDLYQIGHLRSGEYVLRVAFGGVVVSRAITIPTRPYGTAIRADLTSSEARAIVSAQAAGSGFASVRIKEDTAHIYHLGSASVDGWTTEPLIKPSDYDPSDQRISAPVLAALTAMQEFLMTDARIPAQFKSLSRWSARIQTAGDRQIWVSLFSNDPTEWQRLAPITQDLCFKGMGLWDVIVRFDAKTLAVASSDICS